MATQTARSVAFDTALRHDGNAVDQPLVATILTWLKQAYCGLHRHDNLMHFERDRVYLQCASCGRRTPGWTLDEAAPRVVFAGDARRHALSRPRLVRARRMA